MSLFECQTCTAKLHFENMRLVALYTGGYVIQDLAS